jgi:hypothetical protein
MKARRVIAFYPELVDLLGSINAAIFYQQLYYWSDKGTREDGFIYKSKEEIQQETKLTREQQDLIRKRLVELGWIEIQLIKAGGAPTIHYKCLKDIHLSISGKDTNGNVGNPLMDTCETHETSIHKMTHEITTDITGNKNSPPLSASKNLNTNTIPKNEAKAEKEASFEKFWTMYPKKAGKKLALTSWMKLKQDEYPQIKLSLEKHKKSDQWTKNQGQFIPNASTWLNQERWHDEVRMTTERVEIML